MIEKFKKQPRIVKIPLVIFIVCLSVFLIGSCWTSSQEITISDNTRQIQSQMSETQSDIDGLEIQKSELASFSRLKKVATAKGYKYKQGSTAAVVVTDEKKN
jgi:cell division protein FtsL